jgi:transposase
MAMEVQMRQRKQAVKRSMTTTPSNPLELLNPNAAGIDIGAAQHYVAVPAGRDGDGQDVRCFNAFTADLHALARWLKACGIDTVAMESTGVYWIPLFELLEAQGLQVHLVNPRSVKNAPGRKSDVLDCQWIQQLHTYGLLSGAFRPEEQICILRSYVRQRAMLISSAATHIQHMQKALDQMNIKLHQVVEDITGATGMRIIRSILDGQRDALSLAQLRDARCKHDVATIAASLHGNWRKEHLFALKQAVELFDFYQSQITACNRAIEEHLHSFEAEDSSPPDSPAVAGKGPKHQFGFDAHGHLQRISGVDLTRIEGINVTTAMGIIAETGLDMNRWPSEKHFGSWLGLCPGTNVSGGKRLSSRSKPTANRAAHLFRLAAYSLHRSKGAIGAFLRRKKAQLGAPKAITATAYKIARIFYNMLKHGTEYVALGQDYYEKRYRDRLLNNLKRNAQTLGYQLIQLTENTDEMVNNPV